MRRGKMGGIVIISGIEAMELLEETAPAVSVSEARFPNGGIYVIYREGTPVYIGYTARSLRLRLSGHKSAVDSLLGEALKRGDHLSVRAIEPSGRQGEEDYFKAIESALIRKLRPEYNRGGLPPAQWTGEAKRRYEEQQRSQERRQEKSEYTRGVFYRALNEFHSYGIKDAERTARIYLMEKTSQLQPGGDVDIQQLGREAFEIYLKEVASLKISRE